MELIAGSYRIRCRMSSSCLTCSAVPLPYSVRPRRVIHPLAAVSVCLPRVLLFSCPSRLAARLSTRRAGRLAMGVGAVFDYGGRADVVLMSCGGWLLAHRFAYVPPVSIAPLPRHGRRGGELMSPLLASFGSLLSAALVSGRV